MWMVRALALIGPVMGLTATACSNTAVYVCLQGQTSVCSGPGGCEGTQVCSNDGNSWQACVCTGDAGADASGDANGDGSQVGASAKRVFVTSTTYVGSFGGLTQADALCKQVADAATAAGQGSFNGAIWKAWLSDSSTNAIARITDVGPWYRVDQKTKVFDDKAELALTQASLSAPIALDELGAAVVGNASYWTGTMPGGTKDPNTCSDWLSPADGGATVLMGQSGQATKTDNSWTANQSGVSCSFPLHLLCFEQ